MTDKKRINLNIRLQPLDETLLAEVTRWLNSLPPKEKKIKISEALTTMYIAYARGSSSEASDEEIKRCCWQNVDSLEKHRANILNYFSVADPAWGSKISPLVEIKPDPPKKEEINSVFFDDNEHERKQASEELAPLHPPPVD